ncbi:glycosyltransferase family 39 protein [Oryzomonas japonica]|uniref:Glycosyltransferase family 39 protein n=1 Tax=Oryzomonas japonica TaxID=2603858 RepID=A0A7J4ZPH9_9BACT|nr:glycosyltransferase family 39 protein [Oryzomonas japonica]KAB0664523.1 glycosyltransferase family 39 protein [Oryzomonas japonica]
MKDLKAYFFPRHYPALRDILILVILFGGAFFLFLGNAGLIEPDEGRYAEIPREMLERGDFVTPMLNYVAYFEKPPLHYWLNALSFELFGLNEFAARFAGALAGLLTVLLVYHTGRKLFGRREGLFSAFILGTSTGFIAQSRINLTDMTLTLCLSAALCCFIIAADDQERHKGRYYYALYLFSALAVLAKGLVGLLFPAGIIVIYLATTRRWHLLKEMRLPGGSALFLAVAAPWFVLVSARNPSFACFFFIHEHLERFLTTVHDRYQPFWFFIPILLLTMFPWSLYGVRAIARAWGERRSRNGERLLFLLVWAAFIFLFFSASHSKLIPYILPVFPPLALLTGKMFSDLMDGEEQQQAFGPEKALLGALLAVMAVLAIIYPHVRELAPVLTGSGLVRPGGSLVTKPPILSPLGGVVVACLTLSMAAAVWLAGRKRNLLILFAGLCLSSYFLETMGLQLFLEGIEFKKSSKELALLGRQATSHDGCLVSFGYEQSLPFYAGKRVVVVGGRGELEFGSRQGDQTAWFVEETDFLRLWQGERPVAALLKRADYERIAPRLVPAPSVLGTKGKKMLICNRSAAGGALPSGTQSAFVKRRSADEEGAAGDAR